MKYIAPNNKESICVRIFEGENNYVVDNHFLGSFNLQAIPKMSGRNGNAKVDVEMTVDQDGCVTVSATCLDNAEKSHNLIVLRQNSRYSDDELSKLTVKTQNVWIKD